MAGVEGGGGCHGMQAESSEAGKGRRTILLWRELPEGMQRVTDTLVLVQ